MTNFNASPFAGLTFLKVYLNLILCSTPPTIGQATTPPCLEEEDHLQDVEGEGIRGMLLERSSCTLLVEGNYIFVSFMSFVASPSTLCYLNSPLNTFAESKKKSDHFHVWFN
jgi:hypothetical protein